MLKWMFAAVTAIAIGVVSFFAFVLNEADGVPFEHREATLAEMRAPDALLVDIRTAPEWVDTGVIPEAELVTFTYPDVFLEDIRGQLGDKKLVLICRTGNRSGRAAQILSEMIDNPILSVDGGMRDLIAGGYKTSAPVR
ncbi:MAG: sulfurtransferase [Rhodobacterales bacterium]|nr:MAG: sulfurtransferase [Rhodobacterales bacterium]